LPTSYTATLIGLPTHSGMKKSPTPEIRQSRCLFLVAKISLSTPMFVNVSPVLAGGDPILFLCSVLSDTLSPMVSRRACCIPPNTPMAKRFLTALMSLIESWTGSRNASKRSSLCSPKFKLSPPHSYPIRISSFPRFFSSGHTCGMLHNPPAFACFIDELILN
jgi:hypothetical protein